MSIHTPETVDGMCGPYSSTAEYLVATKYAVGPELAREMLENAPDTPRLRITLLPAAAERYASELDAMSYDGSEPTPLLIAELMILAGRPFDELFGFETT